jgi:hypothetical protein
MVSSGYDHAFATNATVETFSGKAKIVVEQYHVA